MKKVKPLGLGIDDFKKIIERIITILIRQK